jgi:hypothetical protein
MRRYPQVGFSAAIRRIRRRNSGGIDGRPGGRWGLVQWRRTRSRCQRSSLLGPLCARVKESAGKKKGKNTTGHGNPYLARVLGEAAVAAGRTSTFLGERYRRIARRRGTKRAIVAVGRSILIIVWHLLADPNLRYTTSARASTTPASTPSAPSATTSASWRPWATRSPCNPPPS